MRTFAFTNKTKNTNITSDVFSFYSLGLGTNYAKRPNGNDSVSYDNKTAPDDQTELLTWKCQDIKKVDSPIKNYYPAKVQNGVQIQAQAAELASETIDGVRCDYPVVCSIQLRTCKGMPENLLEEVIERNISMFYDNSGKFRLPDAIRHSLSYDD